MSSSISRGGADVLASNSQDLDEHTSIIPSPESLQNLGGGFTTCQFGGLAYWDTSSLNKFRVIFVLGGPGAGMYCTRIRTRIRTEHIIYCME
jgi:hypothetical protein